MSEGVITHLEAGAMHREEMLRRSAEARALRAAEGGAALTAHGNSSGDPSSGPRAIEGYRLKARPFPLGNISDGAIPCVDPCTLVVLRSRPPLRPGT
jgi:hypothetical protein